MGSPAVRVLKRSQTIGELCPFKSSPSRFGSREKPRLRLGIEIAQPGGILQYDLAHGGEFDQGLSFQVR